MHAPSLLCTHAGPVAVMATMFFPDDECTSQLTNSIQDAFTNYLVARGQPSVDPSSVSVSATCTQLVSREGAPSGSWNPFTPHEPELATLSRLDTILLTPCRFAAAAEQTSACDIHAVSHPTHGADPPPSPICRCRLGRCCERHLHWLAPCWACPGGEHQRLLPHAGELPGNQCVCQPQYCCVCVG
jgi:hypothetical protein